MFGYGTEKIPSDQHTNKDTKAEADHQICKKMY